MPGFTVCCLYLSVYPLACCVFSSISISNIVKFPFRNLLDSIDRYKNLADSFQSG